MMDTSFCQICGKRVDTCNNTSIGYFCKKCAHEYGDQLLDAIAPTLQNEIEKIKMQMLFNSQNCLVV